MLFSILARLYISACSGLQGSQAMSLFGGVPHRTLSHSASTLLATVEAVSAGGALVAALGLCQRHAASGVASAAVSEALWFRLLQTFVEVSSEGRTAHSCEVCWLSQARLVFLKSGWLWLKPAIRR